MEVSLVDRIYSCLKCSRFDYTETFYLQQHCLFFGGIHFYRCLNTYVTGGDNGLVVIKSIDVG